MNPFPRTPENPCPAAKDHGDYILAVADELVALYLDANPDYRKRWEDDLRADAALAICIAWDGASKAACPEGYLRDSVERAIGKRMKKEKRHDKRASTMRSSSRSFDDTRRLWGQVVDQGSNEQNAIDDRDELHAGCEDDIDREILALMAKEYTHEEIERQLGFRPGSGAVSKRFEKICERIRIRESKTDPK